MKKTLAILLALAMVFSTMTVAFAEGTIGADAQACVTLGMLKGATSAGVTADYLTTNPNRIQAAILFLRLKGLEADALAFTGTDNFADADKEAWAKPIMAYLKAHPELGWNGVGNNMFAPSDKIEAAHYYKVMLTALGYKQNSAEVIGDFTTTNIVEFAASKGLTKVAAVTNFTVNDVAIATIEALKATVKGSDKTLAAALVDAKIITAEKAITAGVYVTPADKTAPTVASITMNNLAEAVVVFSEKVDKTTAETPGNYTPAVAANGAVLGEDGKTVTLTLNAALAANLNSTNVDFTVKNVKDLAGNVMDTAEVSAKAFDATIPAAQKIELTGPQEVKVTFSEPMDSSVVGTVLVDNGVYSATPVLSGNTLTITLGAALTEGSYKVKVSGYKDFAGFTAPSQEFTLAYAKDATPVVASIDKATQEYVIVKFNKAVKGSELTRTTFYHTFTAWMPNAVTQTDDNVLVGTTYYSKVKLDFRGGFTIPAGTTNLVVKKADGTTTAIVDQWGNKMAADATLPVTVTADTTAPTVTKVEAKAENQVVITFSEDLDTTAANTAANYVVKDSAGKVVTGVTPVYSNTNDVYKTTLTIAPALTGGNYTVEVKDLVDKSLAANKIATVSTAFVVTDKTAPSISSAVVVQTVNDTKPELVYITFDGAMATTGAGSILDINNYQLNGAAMPDGSKVELFGSAKRVKITVPDLATGHTLVSGTGADVITVGQLSDANGNKIVALATPVTVIADTAPSTATVKTIALNKILITVTGLLATVPADGISVTNNSTTHTLAAVSFTKDDTKTYITGTLNAAEALTGPAVKPTSVKIEDQKLVTETGKKIDTFTIAGTSIVDGVGPSFKAIAQGSAASYNFTVQFDESLAQIAAGLTATEFVLVDKDGKTLVANVDYTTSITTTTATTPVTNDSITFQLIGSKYATYTGKMTVSTKSAVTYFGDGTGTFTPGTNNTANVFTGKEVTVR